MITPHLLDLTFCLLPMYLFGEYFAQTNFYQTSPLVLSIIKWNSLPSSIVSLTESILFQAALTVFLEGNHPKPKNICMPCKKRNIFHIQIV
uniref:Putative tick transposon n=1 Tax=Rhipicephalus microplus TaxID=6941 RepID=A0A6G5A1G3_RHIMP